MSPELVINLAGQAIYTILKVSAPVLILGVLVGLIVSIFQATTQIQEQTLAFVPKIIAILVSIIFFGPWMISVLVNFTYSLFNQLDRFVG
jgi:flagellar biosynthetic protein FliQ